MVLTDATTSVGFKNVLYLTDFSRSSEFALKYVREIVEQFDSKLFVAHVIESPEYGFVPPQGWAVVENLSEDAAQRDMQEVERQLGGLRHHVLFRRGDVWSAVSDLVASNEIDLIVLGTHGRTGLRRFLMGSVAEEIFRQAACPVLTVGPGTAKVKPSQLKFEHILLATDFGPRSVAAVPYAVSLAREFHSRLTLMHVVKVPLEPLDSPAVLVSEAEKTLHALVPHDAPRECLPEYVVLFGEPANEILNVARERKADLIVLGLKPTEDHLGMATHLAPATAHALVCSAPCPVLTVRS
jgi:nucleotide-binding universal stress UspA family protein